jgi:hypothetical protein
MPSKKSKKDKKKKSRLTDKDILKLIKKLRPKNQQIVRVNVGDKGDKKKGLSAFQPNLVPVVTWQGPSQQQYIPPAPLPISQQPQLQPLIIPKSIPPLAPPAPRAQRKLVIEESEPEVAPISTRRSTRGRPKKVREEAPPSESEAEPFIKQERFTAPKSFYTSTLGETSSRGSYYQGPVVNDRFIAELPLSTIDETVDSAGVVAQPFSSDEWTGTPEGQIELQPVAESPPVETAPAQEEGFIGRPIGSKSLTEKIRSIPTASAFGEEEPNWAENVKLAEILPPTPPEPQASAPLFTSQEDPFLFNPTWEPEYLSNLIRDAPTTAQGLMKDEIVQKIKGGFQGVPANYLTKTGRLKTKIPVQELYNLYISL